MMCFEPGSLVQYQRFNSLVLWPAVICTDDMAPEAMLQTRPYGNVHTTLVLLLGEELNFRWARPSELSEYDPFVPFTNKATVEKTPGLEDAYEMANNVLETSLDLDYWRQQTMHLTGVSDVEGSVSGSDTDSSSDLELQQAIRLSRESYYDSRHTIEVTKRSRDLLTPSRSPPKLVNADGQRIVPDQEKVIRPFEPPLASVRSSTSFLKVPRNSEGRKVSDSTNYGKTSSCSNDVLIDLTADVGTSSPVNEKPITKPLFQQPSLLDDFWNRLNKSSHGPTSDTVDGEISESKQFIQVRVGPAQEVRILQQQAVWNRPYFRDPRWGLNHFDYIDSAWQLQHPALPNINPSDFDWAAEYLESGGFGIRAPHDEAETSAAFAQCCSAWTVADQLSMYDLLDHIIDKLKFVIVEPRMSDVLRFAVQVYASSDDGLDLPAHFRVKDYLAMFMARNWWAYIGHETLSREFIHKLQQLPELERDIYERRVRALDERLAEKEEEDDDEEEEEGEGEEGSHDDKEDESGEDMEA